MSAERQCDSSDPFAHRGRIKRSVGEIPQRVAERALYAAVPGPNGCHISTYSVASHGYAQIGWQRAESRGMTTAHRAAWVAWHGQIPEGMTVDHTCKTRQCVNPKHMRLLSNYENARRTAGRDWPIGQCVRGHPNSELRPESSGKLVCRICKQGWKSAKRTRRSEAS